ncbi:sarcosine oxidase subunit delta [soil metagenome]
MRIACPYCGERDIQEFTYRGDAAVRRASNDEDMFDYVYIRDNPAGCLSEHWYHAQGCRNWLVVQRDTRTHEIFGAELANKVSR